LPEPLFELPSEVDFPRDELDLDLLPVDRGVEDFFGVVLRVVDRGVEGRLGVVLRVVDRGVEGRLGVVLRVVGRRTLVLAAGDRALSRFLFVVRDFEGARRCSAGGRCGVLALESRVDRSRCELEVGCRRSSLVLSSRFERGLASLR